MNRPIISVSVSEITVDETHVLFTATWSGVPADGKVRVYVVHNFGPEDSGESWRDITLDDNPYTSRRAHKTTLDQVVSMTVTVEIQGSDGQVFAGATKSWPE